MQQRPFELSENTQCMSPNGRAVSGRHRSLSSTQAVSAVRISYESFGLAGGLIPVERKDCILLGTDFGEIRRDYILLRTDFVEIRRDFISLRTDSVKI